MFKKPLFFPNPGVRYEIKSTPKLIAVYNKMSVRLGELFIIGKDCQNPSGHITDMVYILQKLFLGINPNETVDFNFDPQNGLKNAMEEMFITHRSSETTYILNNSGEEFKRICRAALNGKFDLKILNGFEQTILRMSIKIIDLFWGNLLDPEKFQQDKVVWLRELNHALNPHKMVRLAEEPVGQDLVFN